MSSDPFNGPGEQRAGIFSRRFHVDSRDAHPWYEGDVRVDDGADVHVDDADIRIVDALPGRTVPLDVPDTPSPEWDPQTQGDSWTPTIRLSTPPAERHAQALWRIVPPRSLQPAIDALGRDLAIALYPTQPQQSIWGRWLGNLGKAPAPPEVIALEVVKTQQRTGFFLRGALPLVARVFDQLLLSYGDLEREVIDTDTGDGDESLDESDYLMLQPGEAISFAELHLRHSTVLPLKLAVSPGRGNPLMAILHACDGSLGETPIPLRMVSQLILTQAPTGWCKKYQTLLDRLRVRQMTPSGVKTTNQLEQVGLPVLFLAAMVVLFFIVHGLTFLLVWVIFPLLAAAASALFVNKARLWVLGWQMLRHEQDVATKLSQAVAKTCLRLYVVGPANAPRIREAALDRLISAYETDGGVNRWRVGRRGQIGEAILAPPQLDQVNAGKRPSGFHEYSAVEGYQTIRDPDRAFYPLFLWERLLLRMLGARARPILAMSEITALWHLLPTREYLR
jgi:hypothetical protein